MTPVFQTVGEVAAVDSGPAFKSAHFGGPDEGVRLLRGDNIAPGALRWDRTKTWPESMLAGYEHLAIQEGDLILGMDRPLISAGLKLARVRPGDLPALLVQRVARIRPHSVDGAYLYHWLSGPEFRQHLKGSATGTQLPHVTLKSIKGFKVPRFGEAAEARIVEVLEDHLSRLDAGVDYLDAAERRLGSLRRALLNDAFFPARTAEHAATAAPASGPEGWRTVALPEVAAIQGGIQKQAKRHPVLNKFPFLRVANVTSTGLDLTEVHEVELFEGEIDKYRLRKGDLLVVEGNGSPDQIGRAAVWDGSIPDAVHQNHLIRVRPGDEIDPGYLGLVWNSPKIREHLSRVSSSSSGLHTLSVRKLQQVMIPLAPFADQQRIVAVTESRLSRLDLQAQHIAVARRRAASLRRSLLAAAFSGRLTGVASEVEQAEEAAADAAGDLTDEGIPL
ncbi:restriction endonuclease subunit S [Streptomyces sp. S.PNR 29]|uniref:restriction endonuclease subunit S n=1 Tax=Streptomyces sp. S.PNR 29 TaxID=2973805 RepID=UPI0025AFADA6|nr:restriction endonuclease subunit S [Streptomyces sp. S.PNR 29]MDN0196905.1 restriction endonuclease subunit S [Streptomyces sp. S.PNR 29]